MAGKKDIIGDALIAAMRALSERDAMALSRTGSDPARFLPYTSNYRRTETSFYDPKYWSVTEDHLEYPEGTIVGTKDKLVPIEPTRRLEEVLRADPELMYRGMSAEELANFLRSGEIKSNNSYNMTGQEGLTYFTSDPDSAQFYANSFAPEGHKPNMERPAYVVAAKRAPSEYITHVPGVAEHEIGVNRITPAQDVIGIYRGTTTDFDPGLKEKGLYVAPRASLNWEEKSLDDILKGKAEGGSVREGYAGKGRVVGDVVDKALKLIEGTGPELTANGIRAYHGSPHKFDRFDISKLGTGEGAQAYGHGLYFAGKEDIAKWYRDKLSRGTFYEGKRIGDMHPTDSPRAAAISSIAPYIADGKDPAEAIAQQWAKWNASYEAFLKRADEMPDKRDKAIARAQSFKDVADELLRLDPQKFAKNPGHMYEVGIEADPNRLLDWNDPLSAQPADVRSAIMPFAEERADRMNKTRRELLDRGVDMLNRPFRPERLQKLQEVADPETFTGENIYRQIQAKLGAGTPNQMAAEASKFLTDQGLHGMKFLDASSRGAGIIEPTNNFVIPEDKRIKIIRRYADGGEVDPYADEAASAKAAMAEKQYSEQPWSEWAGDVVGNAVNTAKAILPTALGGEGRVGVTDIARGAYEGAKDAVTFPGDVLTGKQALFDESGRPLESAVGRSLNTVGAVGGASSFVPVPSNSLRVFGGVKAKTADRNALTQAQIMEGKGASSEEIYNATGWSRGADEQWRFEIPDVGTTVDPDKFQFNLASTQTPAGMITTVGEYLNHPKLLDAYPEFKNMPVKGYYGSGDIWGYYMPRQDNTGFIADPYIALNLNYLKDPSMQRKTLLHELQHAVQQKEGFMRGANKSMFAPDTVPNPKIRVYEEALINDPDMKEFQSISKSKEFQRQIDASNDLYKREWEDKFKALKEEEEKTGVDLTGEWFKLSEAYEKAAHEQFPLLKRRVQLAKSLHERGIPSSRPMKPFLTPEQAYEHTAGEVEARNVQYRLDTPEEELRKSYPASTEDIPRNQQLIDWNNTSWRKGYSVGGASDSDRDIESAMMIAGAR